MEIALEVEIAAPPERVWSFLDDDAKLPLWMPEIVETTYPDGRDGADPVGTRFLQKLKEGGRVKEYPGVVTAYEPPRLLAIRMGEGSFTVDVTYRLAEDAGGTRLDYRADITLASLLTRILGRLFRPLTMRIVRRHMANLKRLAEAPE